MSDETQLTLALLLSVVALSGYCHWRGLWRVAFTEWRNGRLSRLKYFEAYVVLTIFSLLIFAVSALVIAPLIKSYGSPVKYFAVPFPVAIIPATFNILAKRARDTGLPGWLTATVLMGPFSIFMLGAMMLESWETPPGKLEDTWLDSVGGASMFLAGAGVWALLFLPSNVFRR